MGSHNFDCTIYTDADMETAYREAVADAEIEFGHEPYNGTISTTEGAQLSPLHTGTPTLESQIDWDRLTDRLDHLNKWGPCEALPILRVVPARTEQIGTITIETNLPSDLLQGTHYDPTMHAAMEDALTKEVHKRIRRDGQLECEPDYLGRSRTVETGRTHKDYKVSYFAHQVAQAPKTTTRATKGRTETKYFVLPEGASNLPRWDSGYPTQAEARAALPMTLPSSRGWDQSPRAAFEVISMTRRVGGHPLVTHTLDAATGKTTRVKITGHVWRVTEPEQTTDQKGWLFYGMAAC